MTLRHTCSRTPPLVESLVHPIAHSLMCQQDAASALLLNLPLMASLSPALLPTFERSNEATVVDWEGVVRTVQPDEARFMGARRVENTLVDVTKSGAAAISPADWENSSTEYTITGLTSSSAQRANFRSRADVPAQNRQFRASYEVKADTPENVGKGIRLSMAARTGGSPSGGSIAVTLTADWQRVCSNVITGASDTVGLDCRVFGASSNNATGVVVRNAMLEEVSEQANQAPSEYVSIGDGLGANKINGIDPGDIVLGSGAWVDNGDGSYTATNIDNSDSGELRIYLSDKPVVSLNEWVVINFTISGFSGSNGTLSEGDSRSAISVEGGTDTITGDGDYWVVAQIIDVAAFRGLIFKGNADGTTDYTISNISCQTLSHGANLDGVKYFDTLNGNSVSGGVVTEAQGAPLKSVSANINYVDFGVPLYAANSNLSVPDPIVVGGRTLLVSILGATTRFTFNGTDPVPFKSLTLEGQTLYFEDATLDTGSGDALYTWDVNTGLTHSVTYSLTIDVGYYCKETGPWGYVGENASENEYSDSEDLSQWTNAWGGGVTLTLETDTPAPNGAMSVYRLEQIDSTGDGIWTSTSGIPASSDVCLTVFLKPDTSTQTRLYTSEVGGGQNLNVYVDWDADGIPTLGASNYTRESIRRAKNGWWRLEVNWTLAVGTTSISTVLMPESGTTATNGMYAWGFQLEQRKYASTYMPSSGGTAMRNADVLFYDRTGRLEDAAGTAKAEVASFWPESTETVSDVIGLGSNELLYAPDAVATGVPERIYGRDTGAGFPFATGDSYYYDPEEVATAWGDDFITYYDGVAGATKAYSGALQSGAIYIGNASGTNRGWDGTISNVKLYNQEGYGL